MRKEFHIVLSIFLLCCTYACDDPRSSYNEEVISRLTAYTNTYTSLDAVFDDFEWDYLCYMYDYNLISQGLASASRLPVDRYRFLNNVYVHEGNFALALVNEDSHTVQGYLIPWNTIARIKGPYCVRRNVAVAKFDPSSNTLTIMDSSKLNYPGNVYNDDVIDKLTRNEGVYTPVEDAFSDYEWDTVCYVRPYFDVASFIKLWGGIDAEDFDFFPGNLWIGEDEHAIALIDGARASVHAFAIPSSRVDWVNGDTCIDRDNAFAKFFFSETNTPILTLRSAETFRPNPRLKPQ